MSGDNLHAPTKRQDPPDSVATAKPRLLNRVHGTRDGTPEEVMSSVADDLRASPLAFDEEFVTQSLDEILLALIALRDDDTHGTGLMEDIERVFDVQPSPGTVYPRLHDLDAENTLARHDLVQTKQYIIDDDDDVTDRLERAMHQHLAAGLFLRAALDSM